MSGRLRFSPAALAATVGAMLLVASCAKPASAPTTTCGTGQEACGQVCANLNTDAQNCGTCGKVCSSGQTCSSGVCNCSPGLLSCSSGCIAENSSNCGGCGMACPSSGDVCSNHVCSSTCSGGTVACGNGVCANTNTDPTNCGSCGNACPAGSNCNSGSCICTGSGASVLPGGTCTTTGPGAGGSSGGGAMSGGAAGSSGSGATGGSGPGTGATGGSGSGAAGTSGVRACAAPASVIADFEDGTGTDVVQGGRAGWWYVFGDATGGSQTPAASPSGPVSVAAATAPLPTGDTAMCDKFAMHATATGHGTAAADYVGFGASVNQILPPPAAGSKSKNPLDVSASDGISFNIRSTSGNAPPVWFELLNTETQPAPDGVATNNAVDEYNSRGKLLTNIGTSWTTVYVPFGLLAPRYLPAYSESACSDSSVVCQSPAWNPKSLLGLQFSVYPQFSTSTLNYDLWVDDVSLYSGANGLATVTPTGGTPAHPFPVDGPVGACTKPAGASGKFLVDMYNQWKSTFVVSSGGGMRVQRPENGNDTVSEGIGYGMLIAVYFGDKTLFDGLWSYAQGHAAPGYSMLMTWDLSSGGGNIGVGSATDADEDIAFALLKAGKQWGGTYAATAASVIGQIWSGDIDGGTLLPKGGTNYTSPNPTNPSYFAPAYYKEFAKVDTGHNWAGVVSKVYSAIGSVSNSSGLIPAWCGNSCTSVSSNGAADDGFYQYDAHRVAWRLGVDACWNGETSGKTFLTNNANFFAKQSASGIGRVSDIYTLSGGKNGDAEPNSMSAIGTAGVGAMAVGNAFASTAYRFILDASYTPDPTTRKTAYTYFNATVGLLAALTMSGNFNNF
jgi:endo-1,4-beta-D-glucanase Y